MEFEGVNWIKLAHDSGWLYAFPKESNEHLNFTVDMELLTIIGLFDKGLCSVESAQWSLCVPPVLTFTYSTFFPHSVFMCFVWISEKTAIISLYSINRLVFITDTECVYCAVRARSVYIIKVNPRL